jgi:dTDP-glucose 4,6-dehydratase
MHTLIQSDLEDIANFDLALWQSLKGKNIFATGCTGFIGAWIIHSFLYINEKLSLNAELTLLTRNKERLFQSLPVAKHPAIKITEDDITSFTFPEGRYDYIIHGATEVAAMQAGNDHSGFLDNAYLGTKRIIEFAKGSKTEKVLFLSSGAAYGPQPLVMPVLQESYLGAPPTNVPASSYGEAKRFAEQMLFNETQFKTVSARIFASCGPYLPLKSKFAFSNFMEACLKGEDIAINDNGKTTRSYLYASDMTLWLWTLLLKGKSEIYNVGSEQEVTINELAEKIKKVLGSSSEIRILGTGDSYNRYIPSAKKMLDQFNLRQTVSLDDAIIRTSRFLKEQHGF